MKRKGFLYEELISIDNCKRAIIRAAKHKHKRRQVRTILDNIDLYAEDLSLRLQKLEFTSPYTKKIIKDGLSGKERELLIPKFYPDQCAHHAVMQLFIPIVKRTSYYWSCANIPKRGIDHASKKVERATIKDKRTRYCLKLDIKKFYPSMPLDLLKARFRTIIKDEKFLNVLDSIVESVVEGLPIGNYSSPWFAELYLQPIDRYILASDATKHYIRYADDMVIIGSNKRKLHRLKTELIAEVNKIGLEIKHNMQVFKIQENGKGRRIDFIGKCYGIGFTTVRKSRSLAFIRQSRKIKSLQDRGLPIPYKMAAGFISRSNLLKRTKTQALRVKYYDTINMEQLKEVVRNHDLHRQSEGLEGTSKATCDRERYCLHSQEHCKDNRA